jgi:hypothetical protein
MNLRSVVYAALLAILLAGCSTFKNPFSGSDNTVLPGQRESVLPPEQQTARDPVVTGDQQADLPAEPNSDANAMPKTGDCKLNDPNCDPGVDQEAGSTGIE